MKIISVAAENKSYNIYIHKGILKNISTYFSEIPAIKTVKKIMIITDYNVSNLHMHKLVEAIKSKGYEISSIAIKPGEESKNFDTLLKLYKELSEFKITRTDLIITLGGGVVGDLGGFAAATYLRGVSYIQIPTSLLAQVDSSIGGKVAVDLPQGKNLVGSFYNPCAVFIDPELLGSLPRRILNDGLGEVIKYGCIKDGNIIKKLKGYKNHKELLENIEDIIYTCCSIKKAVVEIDEKDQGERMLLNFGHTIGHAIEKYYNYNKYSHGEAVGIGMVTITEKSEKLGLTKEGTSRIIADILKKYDLPVEMPEASNTKLLDTIKLDKKSSGEFINVVLIKEIGKAYINKIKADEMESFI